MRGRYINETNIKQNIIMFYEGRGFVKRQPNIFSFKKPALKGPRKQTIFAIYFPPCLLGKGLRFFKKRLNERDF